MGYFFSKPATPSPFLEKPWRQMNFRDNPTDQHFVENYKPQAEERQFRILLHGPVGAGKSSFINSVNGVLQKKIRRGALVENTSRDCFTKEYKTYKIPNGNTFYPFVLNDMMGLKYTSRRNRRNHVKDVKRALKGHIKDGYVFNPEKKLSKDDERYYNSAPTENDKVHVLVCVVDANTVSLMNKATVEAIQDVRDEATDLKIQQVAIFTKIDEAFPEINQDVRNVYRSRALKEKIDKFSVDVGIPVNCIFPVKNYHSETELNPDIDALIMNALRNIIEIGNESLDLRCQT